MPRQDSNSPIRRRGRPASNAGSQPDTSSDARARARSNGSGGMNNFRVRRGLLPFAPIALALAASATTGTARRALATERVTTRPAAATAVTVPTPSATADLSRLIEQTDAIPRVGLQDPSPEVLER